MLVRNDWNVAVSARDVHLPEQTVREWAKQWKIHGPEPEMLQDLETGADVFIDDAERIRGKLLKRLEEVIPKSTSVRELTVAIGILDDKIAKHHGIRELAQPVPQVSGPQGPKELQAAIGEMFIDALATAADRRRQIETVEVVEPAQVGPPPPEEE